jgi:hypothetical protein
MGGSLTKPLDLPRFENMPGIEYSQSACGTRTTVFEF